MTVRDDPSRSVLIKPSRTEREEKALALNKVGMPMFHGLIHACQASISIRMGVDGSSFEAKVMVLPCAPFQIVMVEQFRISHPPHSPADGNWVEHDTQRVGERRVARGAQAVSDVGSEARAEQQQRVGVREGWPLALHRDLGTERRRRADHADWQGYLGISELHVRSSTAGAYWYLTVAIGTSDGGGGLRSRGAAARGWRRRARPFNARRVRLPRAIPSRRPPPRSAPLSHDCPNASGRGL